MYNEGPDGWQPIIEKLLETECSVPIEIYQIKEKFAGLRVYYSGECPIFAEALGLAEIEAAKTCQVCGDPGELDSTNGWWRIVCSRHRKMR